MVDEECDNLTEEGWIPNNISQRECIHYAARPLSIIKNDPKDSSCQCGRKRSAHDKRYIKDGIRTTKWKTDTHTQLKQTNTYGEVEFVGVIRSFVTHKPKKYVRLDYGTPPNKVLELLKDHWKLGLPKLLISMAGGADFHMNSRLQEVFRKGLIKAALSRGAWIITGGTHGGVSKYVGEVADYALERHTVNRNDVVVIGITSWGVIDQKENLIKDNDNPSAPAYYRMDSPGGVKLDPNHTHFLLVDDGTSGNFDVEIKLRAKIERAISKCNGDGNVSVPTVCVAVEGGPNTIFTVRQAVLTGTPVVVMAGSGRAANILAFAAQRATEVTVKDNKGSTKKHLFIGDNLREKLIKRITEEFGEEYIHTLLTCIHQCLEKSELFNVYDMDASSGIKDFDKSILLALLRAQKYTPQDQLKFTLEWNRIDVAKCELFSYDRNWKKGELDAALHYALVHNQVDFVKLFLENGVNLKDYLTVQELTLLYNEVQENTLIYEYLDKQRGRKPCRRFTLRDVGKVVDEMTMDSYEPLYLRDEARYVLTEAGICGPIIRDVAENDEEDTGSFKSMDIAQPTDVFIPGAQKLRGNLNTFDNPIRELLIWSVLQGRKEMSQLFWEGCKEMISAALTSCMILKCMSEKEDDVDHKEVLHASSDWFEDLAIGVLNHSYNKDKKKTSVNLLRERHQWGRVTCFSLAVNCKMKKFLIQQGLQNLLTEIWMGKLSTENPTYILTLCLFCPPLIYSLIKFREEDNFARRSLSKRKKYIKANCNTAEGVQLNESFLMVKIQDPVSNCAQNNSTKPNGGKELSMYQRFKLFYDSPKIIFIYNLIFHLLFLGLFSYIMLANFNPNISVAEYVLVGWVATLFTEEIRQIAQGECNSWQSRIIFWITDYWNIVDLAALILFSVGFVMRLYDKTFAESRIILSIDLMIYYIRLLQGFSINQNLGPKLIMISKMIVDLAFFLCILFVFMIAYGIASQAIMFPNTSGFFPVLKGIFYKSYFQMYGELFLENIKDDSCTATGGISVGDIEDPCPEFTWVAICLLSGYMLFSNVLLLNLLIAMFSNTFSAVHVNADQYWKLQRYKIVAEYFNRPRMPPPFIAVSHFDILVCYIIRMFYYSHRWIGSPLSLLKQQVSEAEVKALALWESLNGEDYMAAERQKQQQDINERVGSLLEKVDEINLKVECGGKTSNAQIVQHEDQKANVLQAVLTLVKELDQDSLEMVTNACQERRDFFAGKS